MNIILYQISKFRDGTRSWTGTVTIPERDLPQYLEDSEYRYTMNREEAEHAKAHPHGSR